MTGTSLDGRTIPLDKGLLQKNLHKMKSLKRQCVERLRPASPPKINPWTTKRPAALLAEDWPSITPDFENLRDTPKEPIKIKIEPTDEEVNSQDTKDRSSTASKDPGIHSPSRKILQAAAPRAGNRFDDESRHFARDWIY